MAVSRYECVKCGRLIAARYKGGLSRSVPEPVSGRRFEFVYLRTHNRPEGGRCEGFASVELAEVLEHRPVLSWAAATPAPS